MGGTIELKGETKRRSGIPGGEELVVWEMMLSKRHWSMDSTLRGCGDEHICTLVAP